MAQICLLRYLVLAKAVSLLPFTKEMLSERTVMIVFFFWMIDGVQGIAGCIYSALKILTIVIVLC